MPHNLAHLLYELRRKAGHSDFLSEEAITVIRQALLNTDINITIQSQVRGEKFDAAKFTAANSEQLEIADNTALSVSDAIDWSIAGWFRLRDSASFQNIIGHDISGQLGWHLYMDTGNQINFQLGGQTLVTGANSIVDDAWTFFAGWFNNATTRFGLRLNAGSDIEVAYTQTLNDVTAKFIIGNFDGDSDHCNGALSKWGLWKKVLSSSEITSLYNSGIGLAHSDLSGSLLTSLQAYWDLDEVSGTRNDSESTNNLTDINTVTSLRKGTYYVEQEDVRRNFCLNPSFEHDLTSWTESITATGTTARDDSQSNSGQESLKLNMTNSGASGQIVSRNLTITGLAASEVWSIGVEVRISVLTTAKMVLRLEFLDNSDVVQATHNVESTTISTAFTQLKNENRTSPATTTKLRISLILESTASSALGTIHCDGVIIEKAATVGTSFDGDSQNCFWEVTMHAGESINDTDGTAAICGYFKVSA